MKVLVDTPIWSFALRRKQAQLAASQSVLVEAWRQLIADSRIALLGPIRQEVLSGVAQPSVFESLRVALQAFPDEPIHQEDYEEAARCSNACRNAGISGSSIDFLICAVAMRHGFEVFSTDRDFENYARVLPLHLFNATGASST